MIRYLFLATLLFCTEVTYGQLDTQLVFYNAKLLTVTDGQKLVDSIELSKQVKEAGQVLVITSTGFDSNKVIFLLVKKRDSRFYSDSMVAIDSLVANRKLYAQCNYILAYRVNTSSFYKLKGFHENDFRRFYNDFAQVIILTLDEEDYSNKKRIETNFYIEEVEMGCLYSSLKGRNRNKYECLLSCKEKDRQILNQISNRNLR